MFCTEITGLYPRSITIGMQPARLWECYCRPFNSTQCLNTTLLQATVKVHAQTDNVAGVKLPKFEQLDSGSAAKMNLTGLGAGGQQVQVTRKVSRMTLTL